MIIRQSNDVKFFCEEEYIQDTTVKITQVTKHSSNCQASFLNLWADHMTCGDFYPTFKWNFLSQIKKFIVLLEKDFVDVFLSDNLFIFSVAPRKLKQIDFAV